MNALVALLLKDRISQFTYVDKLAGMVRAITRERAGGTMTIPVDIAVDDPLACSDEEISALVPDEGYGCIVYFEDRGLRRIQSRTRGISFESRLRLVCWVNTAKFSGDNYAADRIMEQFIAALQDVPTNEGPFIGVRHQVETIPERGKSLFGAYTYPDTARQYLLFPFDAFAIDILTTMRIRPGCEDQVTQGEAECWTPPTNRRRRFPWEFTCEELQDPVNGLTAEQLGSGCLNCGTGGTCDLCDVVQDNIADEVIACIAGGDVPLATNTLLARAEATPDIIVEGILNSGKGDEVKELLCDDCPLTIQLNGTDAFEVANACATPLVDYELVDEDDNPLPFTIVGGKIQVTMPQAILYYATEAEALTAGIVPTTTQVVSVGDTKRLYAGDGTSSVGDLVAAKVYNPSVREEAGKGIRTTFEGSEYEVQLNTL